MLQHVCYGFGCSLCTRLLARHEMWWHKDTRRSHANRILTLPDKMRLFLLLLPFFYPTVEIIPGAFAVPRRLQTVAQDIHIALLYIQYK